MIGKLVITESKQEKEDQNHNYHFYTNSVENPSSHPKIGWGSKRIMQVANELYQQGLITYLRTDSTRTSPEARSAMATYIENEIGRINCGQKKIEFSQKRAQHTRRTRGYSTYGSIQQGAQGLEKPQLNLYRLIWSRFAASMMIDSEYSTISLRGS